MTLKDLKILLKRVSIANKNVHEFNDGDIYENLNSGEHKYGFVNWTINSIVSNDNNLVIDCYLFYVDKLLEDNSNKLDIWSVGCSTIQQILESTSYNANEFFEYDNTEFTNFTEKFSDLCAGVYAKCNITILNNVDRCDEDWTAISYEDVEIENNGTYIIGNEYNVIVDVAGGEIEKETLTVYENGDYQAPSGVLYNNVNVRVPQVDAYTKEESDNKYQVKGNYAKVGDSYTKEESHNRFQEKGNYAKVGDSYTKTQSDSRYLQEHQSLDGYATKQWVEGKGYLTEHQSLSEYLKSSVAAITYATKEEIAGTGIKMLVVSELPAVGEEKTIYLVPSENPKHENIYDEYVYVGVSWELIGNTNVDLSDYATKQWVENKGYLTQHQDISGKQDVITDLDSIREGAELGKTAIQEHQSLEGYATEEWVEDKGYLTEHQDISGKQDVIDDLDSIREGASKGETAIQSNGLKTINNVSIVGTGNIVTGGEFIEIVHELGDSKEAVISQYGVKTTWYQIASYVDSIKYDFIKATTPREFTVSESNLRVGYKGYASGFVNPAKLCEKYEYFTQVFKLEKSSGSVSSRMKSYKEENSVYSGLFDFPSENMIVTVKFTGESEFEITNIENY